MDVKQITSYWLRENGYDGLHAVFGECACEVDDLMPCGRHEPTCTPGWKTTCPERCGDHDWHITSKQEEVDDGK